MGLPSVVIMTLNPEAPPRAVDATSVASAQGVAAGRRLYSQICSSCHGNDGNTVPDKSLANLSARMSFEEAVEKVKFPVMPMPTLYPELISEQDIQNITRFVFEELRQGTSE